ncbi:MAG: hypothetical protein WAQ99_21975 [Pyrinomonadaceae bacterium]
MLSATGRKRLARKEKWVKVRDLVKAPFTGIDLEKELADLVKSIRFSAFKVGLGITAGIALIVLRHWWAPMKGDSIKGIVGEHLGMGLIVAAVAVFGYEWRSQSKEAMELSKRLATSIDDVKQVKNDFALVDGLLTILEEKGLGQLDTDLRSMLGENSGSLVADFKRLVQSIFRIQNRRTWINEAYVDFIQKLFSEYVVKNATELRNINDGGTGHFILPSTAGLTADNLLATHIKKAVAGDSYDVISDIVSWRDSKLKVFDKESQEALERGVTIRRAFNFFLSGHPDSRDSSFNDTCGRTLRTLVIHKDVAANSKGKYHVRFFWTEELKEFQESTDASYSLDAQHWHFGLFKRNTAPQVVTRFKVEKTNLSDMEVNSNESDIRGDAEIFEIFWDAATRLDDELIKRLDLYLKGTAPTYALGHNAD